MNQVDNITDQASQQTLVELSDGSILTLTLNYNAATQRWVMDVLHPLLSIHGISICMHPNLLRQWQRVINFGLACTSINGQDPVNVDDFAQGRCSLYALTQDDVVEVEINIFDERAV